MTARGAQALRIELPGVEVGTLTWLPTQQIIFAFAEEYLENKKRPTLSLSYQTPEGGIRTNIRPTSVRLPPYFSNLLPEGKLKTYLARKANVHESQEFFLLAELSSDLPGAVRLRSDSGITVPNIYGSAQENIDGTLRYSLAGIQLKLSGDLTHEKIVIPTSGAGGHWIVKLPVPSLPRINELEYSMLTFAKKLGIEVPDIRLVSINDIDGLPNDLPDRMEGDCLISRRFDRTSSAMRIHAEDFCQVFGQYDKYNPQFNYQSIAAVLWSQIGRDAIEEFIRRLVFSIAIGNADMHLKNWSLVYPNGRKPKLSPAYDFIPSAPIYPNSYQKLALKLAGENRFEYISIEHFKKLAALAKLPEQLVLKCAEQTAKHIHEVWAEIHPELPLSSSEIRLIANQIGRSTLLYSQQPIAPPPVLVAKSTAALSLSMLVLSPPELDVTLDDNKILYAVEDGRHFETTAPKRMTTDSLSGQINDLVKKHPDLKAKRFTPKLGTKLFLEWHEEHVPRIEARLLSNPLTETDLFHKPLVVTGEFRSQSFEALREMNELHRLNFVDFLLSNGSLWSAYCQINELQLISTLPDGKKFGKIELVSDTPQQIVGADQMPS